MQSRRAFTSAFGCCFCQIRFEGITSSLLYCTASSLSLPAKPFGRGDKTRPDLGKDSSARQRQGRQIARQRKSRQTQRQTRAGQEGGQDMVLPKGSGTRAARQQQQQQQHEPAVVAAAAAAVLRCCSCDRSNWETPASPLHPRAGRPFTGLQGRQSLD